MALSGLPGIPVSSVSTGRPCRSVKTWLVCTGLRLLAKVLVQADSWSAETIGLPASGSAAARLFPRRIVDDG